VVQGVAHNLGFGKSIIHNEAFAAGDYSTAFIPDFYPEGYNGDDLTRDDRVQVSLAAFFLKNKYASYSNAQRGSDKVHYVSIMGKGDEADQDWKVERHDGDVYTITDLSSGESTKVDLGDIKFEHNSLIKMTTKSDDLTTL